MKKTSTLVLMFVLVIAANAQDLSKNSFLLGGTAGAYRQTVDRTDEAKLKQTTLNINPAIGKFYRDNRMAGVNLFYALDKRTSNTYKMNQYGLGAFLRQYRPLGKALYLFAEEGASFYKMKSEEHAESVGVHTVFRRTSVGLNLYPGVAYSVSKKLMLELSLNNLLNITYMSEHRDEAFLNGLPGTRRKDNTFSINTGLGSSSLGYLAFGMRYRLK